MLPNQGQSSCAQDRNDRNVGQIQEQERQLRQQILSAAQAAAAQAGELPSDSHNTLNGPAVSQAVPALIAELSAIDVTSQTITSMQVRPAALLKAG